MQRATLPLPVLAILLLATASVMILPATRLPEAGGRPTTLVLNKEEFMSGDVLVFSVVNQGDSQLAFGVDYEIEYLFEGEWRRASWLLPSFWVDILLMVSPGRSHNQSVELFPVYEGTYRISKEVWDQDIRTGVSEVLSAEFQVVEETPEEEIPEIPLLPDWFLHELLQLCVLPTHGGWVNRTWVVSRLMDRFRETELVLGSSEFLTGFGGRESFFVGVRHATAEWVEQWPSHCGFDVEIRIDVHSWALTELKDVWRGEREQEPEPLMQSISIQVEYSSLSKPRVFVLVLDGHIVAEVLLDPGDPPLTPAVMDLGNVMMVRWEFHTIRVTLDDEVLLGRRFFLEGEGYLWVGVGDTEADFGIQDEPPLWY